MDHIMTERRRGMWVTTATIAVGIFVDSTQILLKNKSRPQSTAMACLLDMNLENRNQIFSFGVTVRTPNPRTKFWASRSPPET